MTLHLICVWYVMLAAYTNWVRSIGHFTSSMDTILVTQKKRCPIAGIHFGMFGTFPQSALRKGLEKIKAQHVVNWPTVALFNYSWKIIWAVSDPTPIARREDFSFVFVTFWPSYVSNRQEMRWSDVNYPWRLYATVKLDFISLTTRPGVVYL